MADESDRDEPVSDQRSSNQPAEPEPTQPDPNQAQPNQAQPNQAEPTQPLPAEPQPKPAVGDETAVAHPPNLGPSGTTVMPAVPPAPPVWSARAQVRPPEPEEPSGEWDQPAPSADDWEADETPPGRGWLAPGLITLLVLVLLAILAFGIWLVVRSQDNGTVTPTTPAATSQSTAASAPPQTTAAVTTPPPTAPVTVGVPDVRGLDFNTAAGELRALGFQVSRTTQNSTSVAAGNVIGTDPPNGSRVAPSSTVTVIVSAGAPTTAPPPSPRTPTPTATASTRG